MTIMIEGENTTETANAVLTQNHTGGGSRTGQKNAIFNGSFEAEGLGKYYPRLMKRARFGERIMDTVSGLKMAKTPKNGKIDWEISG